MRRTIRTLACAVLWACAVLCLGCSSGEASDESVFRSARPLRDAQLAPTETQVVAVVNFAGGQCTGAPIAPDLVLTARHCIGKTNEITTRVDCDRTQFLDPDSAGALFVLATPTITDEPADYNSVVAWRVLPGDDPAICGRDIALLRLEKPMPVRPLIPRVDAPPVPGEAYTAVGYGDDEGEAGSGIRRVLADRGVVCVGAECDDRGVRDTEFLGTDGVCSGDSGGPALDADRRILGVASRGLPGCRSPIYTSVAAFSEFLREEALAAAERTGEEPPAWALGYSTEARFNHPVGATCRGAEQCESGICREGSCTRSCSPQGPCPAGYECDAEAGQCLRLPDSGPASSCAYASPGARRTTVAAWWLVLSLALAVRRLSPTRRIRSVGADERV